MRRRTESREIILRPEDVGLRQFPQWGTKLETMVNSAKQVIEQSEAVGGTNDPRLPAARRVLEYAERMKEKEVKKRE